MKYSIIVPIYNAEKYLRKCLDSLVNQTYSNYEIILVNDGSVDNSNVIIEEYAKKYNFIKSYTKENTGVADTRNYGISKVNADYMLFVDSDDYIELNTLEIINNNIKDADVLKFGYNIITDNKVEKINNPSFNKKGNEAFIDLCETKIPFDMPCIYAFKTSFWNNNSFVFDKGHMHEDFGLIPLVILKSNSLISIDNNLYNYYMSENSITRSNDIEKLKNKAYDYLYHFDNLYNEVNNNYKNIDKNVKEIFNSYISNALLLKAKTLKGKYQNDYIKELKLRKINKLVLSNNFIRKIKKLILSISIKLYLKIF